MTSQLLSMIPQMINLNTDEEYNEGDPSQRQYATSTAGYDQSQMDEKYFTG